MTDLLIISILVGFAVTYVVELLDLTFVGNWFNKSTINAIFTLPLSFGGVYLLTPEITWDFVVLVPATTFISLALSKFVNKPDIISGSRRIPRL